jgi:hypothetical protein
MKRFGFFFVTGIMLLTANAGVYGYSPRKKPDAGVTQCYPGIKWNWGDEFFQRVNDALVLATDKIPGQVVASAFVADDGKLYNAKLDSECTDLQVNADCFQAFLSAGCFKPVDQRNTGKLKTVTLPFCGTIKSKFQSNAVNTFFKLHPELQESSVVIRKIPVDVLVRYPELFRNDEILGIENVQAIPRATYLGIIAIQGARWQGFFEQHKSPTKEQVLQFARGEK